MKLRRSAASVCAAALTIGALTTPAQATAPSPLQTALDRIVADGVPGAIVLSRQGDRVSRLTSGVSNVDTKAPIRAGDRFRIGSNTKSYVSTVILQLVGEGRIKLSDRVERWLPGQVPNGSAITVRQLLNHTSGLYDYGLDPRLLTPYETDPGYYWSPAKLVALATSHPPLFAPGTGFSYSNTNYILLGLIIEAVTRHSVVEEVRTRLFKPLKLTATSFPIHDPRLHGPHTHGYLTNLAPTPVDVTTLSPSIAWTAGGISSTVDDLARFHRALFTGRLLRPAQQRQLKTTVPGESYGLGVFKIDTPCGPAWGHDGSFPGYFSISLTSPDGVRQAVLALNSDRTLTDQTWTDVSTAADTAFCGRVIASTNRTRTFRFRTDFGSITPAG